MLFSVHAQNMTIIKKNMSSCTMYERCYVNQMNLVAYLSFFFIQW